MNWGDPNIGLLARREMFYEKTNRGKHNRIYFQDRERGVFLVK